MNNKATISTDPGFTTGVGTTGYQPATQGSPTQNDVPIRKGEVEKHYDSEVTPSIPDSSTKANPGS